MKINYLLTITLLLHSLVAFTQNNHEIFGSITDSKGFALEGVTIFVKKLAKGTNSNTKGQYTLSLPKGSHVLTINYLGYKTITTTLTLNKTSTRKFDFTLVESSFHLNDILIIAKTKAQQLREQAYAVEAIDTKMFRNLSTNANDILAKLPGVNIRQSGGLGSNFNLSLNGLSGKQVRTFIDGIPMDYFGSSLSLNNFSANLIDHIEVYKGVVPIHLASDALGGAINVVTSNRVRSFLDVSYSLGSFGTHVSSINGQYRNPKNGFTLKLKSFYNQSENNYKIPVKLLNIATGKEDSFYTQVSRFHAAYKSKMVWLETGVTAKKFADQLLVGIMYSDNSKEIQQPANAIGEAKIPYGEVLTLEKKWITNLRYAKKGLWNNKLSINAYLVGVFSDNTSRDISDYRYDWYGNKTLRADTNTGEIENRKTNLILSTKNLLANTNLEYQLTENSNLALSYSFNSLRLEGTDDYKEENNTQFSHPSTLKKQVVAIAFTNALLDKKLKSTFFSKLYNYKINSLETNYSGTEVNFFNENKQHIGLGFSTTYKWEKLQLKASFEKAVRFPEIIELFGDGLNYTANPALRPEKSNNYNVGFIHNSKLLGQDLTVSVNGFLRDAKDFIIPQIVGIQVFHMNNSSVLSKGIDFSTNYSFSENLLINLNATYIDLRDNNKWRNGIKGTANTQYKIRLPNEPYLFGNLSLSYKKEELLKKEDHFSITANQNYVHSFYYKWENLAAKNKGQVPEQWTTNLDIVYSLKNGKYNTSFGISNLWNTKVYDNYQQLKPGRTYNLKFRYFIN